MPVETKNEKSWKFNDNKALRELAKALGVDPGTATGPWDDEPDKIQWIDPVTDLDCLILRNRAGGLCGYVGIAPSHPLHGQYYSKCLEADCDEGWCDHSSPERELHVHGGITFSNKCADGEPLEGICHIPEPGRPADVWWFGFDCGHCGDLQPQDLVMAAKFNRPPISGDRYRNVEYVKGQCQLLAVQLSVLDNK